MPHSLNFKTIIVAIATLFLGSPLAFAADHRDAPTIDDYSAVDITDVFMFPDPAHPSNLVMVMGTASVADPLFATSYHFQPNALYRFNFSTNKAAKPTASIDFVFSPFGNGPKCPAPAPGCQTFRATFPRLLVVEGMVTPGTSGDTHVTPIPNPGANGLIQIFAGPREDPFFFDLVGFNRSIAAGAPLFTGVDAFKGKNINAIVVEFPASLVFPHDICVGAIGSPHQTPCSAWAVTYLGDFKRDDAERFEAHPEELRQVDRMGNPAVNTALIPASLKDAFNFGDPDDDAHDFAAVILKQILTVDQKFGECPGATSAASCNPHVPLLAAVAVPDTLKFAYDQPFHFPNGRQLADRVTDLLIALIVNLPLTFTDGTSVKSYCSVFPFVAPPLQLASTAPFGLKPQVCP